MATKSKQTTSSKSSVKALGAKGKKDRFSFDPEDLTLVVDEKSPLWDDRALTPAQERLVKSIMHFGVLKAILIRKNPETGKVEVVDGRKRTLGCREANRRLRAKGEEPKEIWGTVQRGDADTLMGVMIAANIHEPETFMNRARKMESYLGRGMSEEQTGVTFGCSVAVVRSTMAILGATAAVRQAVGREQISVTEAGHLAKMEPEEQRKKLAKLLAEAPRAKGKTRRADTARAKEILGDGAPVARKKSEMVAKLKELGWVEGDRAVLALQWALGQSASLDPLGERTESVTTPVAVEGAAPPAPVLRLA
jgi:ParB family chromosome partitioning protein